MPENKRKIRASNKHKSILPITHSPCGRSKISIVPTLLPSPRVPRRPHDPIRILHPAAHPPDGLPTHTHPRPARALALDAPQDELAPELDLERGDGCDHARAGLLEDGGGRGGAVCLELEEEVRVQGVWELVAGEEDLGHREELAGARRREGESAEGGKWGEWIGQVRAGGFEGL